MAIEDQKESTTPFNTWLDNFKAQNNTTLRKVAERAGMKYYVIKPQNMLYPSLHTLSEVLQRFPTYLNLSEDQTDELSEAVVTTIEGAFAKGHEFRDRSSHVSPKGGVVPTEPFPQAFYYLAKSRGFETQMSLAKALGKKTNSPINSWYRSINVPTVDEFAQLVVLFLPNDERHDRFVEEYSLLLAKGKGVMGGMVSDSERAVMHSRRSIVSRVTPFDSWLEDFIRENPFSLATIKRKTGLRYNQIRTSVRRQFLSLEDYSEILQRFPDGLALSEEETEIMAESIARTIEAAFESGHRFSDQPDAWKIHQAQDQIQCKTYNGKEAGDVLGVTSERIRQLRNELGLPYLLTEQHLDQIIERRRNKKSKVKKDLTSS